MKKIKVLPNGLIELPLDVKPGEVIYDETTDREVVVNEVITPEEAKRLKGWISESSYCAKKMEVAKKLIGQWRTSEKPKNKT